MINGKYNAPITFKLSKIAAISETMEFKNFYG